MMQFELDDNVIIMYCLYIVNILTRKKCQHINRQAAAAFELAGDGSLPTGFKQERHDATRIGNGSDRVYRL